MPDLITPDLVALDADLGSDKATVVRRLAGLVAGTGRATSADGLADDALAREAQAATGLPGGIAIPHCRSEAVTEASLAFARLDPKVDFGAPDGPADLVFLIAAPAHGDADHLTLLTALARALVRPDFVASLRAAGSADDVVRLVQEVVSPEPAPAGAPAASGSSSAATAATPAATPAADTTTTGARRSVVVVSACPTGIAHTYMAADKLTAAGEAAGVDVHVETQGSSGSTPLDPAVIRAADAVIFAVDVGVRDRDRFAGKPLVQSGTKRAINEPDVMLREALAAVDDPNARRVPGGAGGAEESAAAAGGGPGVGTEIRRWLLTGVSYMIPFVAAGGLLIALGFLFGGYQIVSTDPSTVTTTPVEEGSSYALNWVLNNTFLNLPDVAPTEGLNDGFWGYLGAVCIVLGQAAFGFLVPALAGYIAYAIADRPGIVPGFVVGAVSVSVGAGFIGGLVGGIIAGFAARWISGWKLPTGVRGLQPVVIIPLLATLISSGLMAIVLGRPLAAALTGLGNWLNGLTGTSAALLGIILGLMMCFDLGGPLNKAAYVFATTGLTATATGAPLVIMATVMAAGMVPPLAMALSTVIRPKLYTPAERDQGKAAWLLGASFISEGAIPFAAADPLRVIPSMMLGGATTGAIVAAAGVELRAPHGGIFVLFAITGILWFIVGIVAGTVVGALAVTIAKSIGRPKAEAVPEDAVDMAHAHNAAPVTQPARA
ncbi:PTS system D-fructose-specific IIA component (F1P-forming), Frc family /PTS system D-fructose-specific IIB component (F1P-forming), Frc family /PTS system D-fructose-specific IIC component (F1P-forming), Frc family [Geodermatophilus africanus]|uniref:PTS system D-fructose-specific IIA component (F1P-forming), Frc family /PTS system D-fructose-specific IIB component (F1P-forming), Frc family /PTS system D-fructose-specific IIC component (F1P-for... n=1 Tax=Geodermatophilus africanus TaxID=1137993 RepID=A0A1H3JYT9_9ACTN|nr:fructose-specific PTS transporter subunit EIIC [Geodermatophilus africanus]SDY45107.1 PTS system D-fructose-specific IIA component (F1P-forming), Frc family /PTS system D-fructose-specific IIB component (F1P-forming), Frc family /PTS system D-fructose-specific IIC component (F1P-forming), Frc family [Geodermatophilus africanus]